MKRFLVVATIAGVASLVMNVTAALAHHTSLTARADCVNGVYNVTWTLGPTTDLDKSPKVLESNRSAIPVGTALGASNTFTESVAGSTTSVNATVKTRWSNGVTDTDSFTLLLGGSCKPPQTPVCPPGYTPAGTSQGVLLCTRETTVEKVVEKPVEVIREVPGPERVVEKVVYKDRIVGGTSSVRYITKYRTRIKYRTRVVYKTVVKREKFCPKPPQCEGKCDRKTLRGGQSG